MRVLMLSWEYPPVSVGGLARHVQYLSREVARRGHLVDVVTQGRGTPAGRAGAGGEAVGLTAPAVEETPVGEGLLRVWRRSPYPVWAPDFLHWVDLLNYGFLEAVLALHSGRADQPRAGCGAGAPGEGLFDIIHAHDWLVAFTARAVKHACRLPLVATIHATEAGRHNGIHDPWQRYISEVEWWLTYEAWRVICCSDYMEAELAGQFQLPPDKIRVIPNGIDPRDVAAGAGLAAGVGAVATARVGDRSAAGAGARTTIPVGLARDRFAQPGEDIILFVGRLVREKGVDTLLDAFPAIIDRRPATALVIAGTGPNEDSLRRRVREMGLGGRVHFTGYLDDQSRNHLLRWASAAVVPSYYEPFGLTALEAMAAGVPVVVSDTGGLGETVTHGETGLKVPPANPGELASAVLTLLGDPSLARRLAQRALVAALDRYSWSEVAAKTEAVYDEVVRAARDSGWSSAATGASPAEEDSAESGPGRAEARRPAGEDWNLVRRRTRAMTRNLEPIGRYNPPTRPVT